MNIIRIDLPQCNLKTCGYYSDGNCIDKKQNDICEYAYMKRNELDEGYLSDWYISSVDETVNPVWTENHIKELVNDFVVIPRIDK